MLNDFLRLAGRVLLRAGMWLLWLTGALLILTLGAVLALTGTTSGTRFAVQQVNEYLADVISLDLDIVSGSALFGFRTAAPFKVDVRNVVTVSADSLDIDYNVFDVALRGALYIDHLRAPGLTVVLSDSTSEEVPEDEPDDGEEFRLDIPVHIVLKNLSAGRFAYLSQIVDVRAEAVDLSLDVHGDAAAITAGQISDLEVHLKLAESDESPAEAAAQSPDAASGAEALVFGFNGGNGAVEPIGEIPLPLDAAISGLSVERGRFYMDGFDTGVFSLRLSALWRGTRLMVPELKVSHEFGSLGILGSLDFKDYLLLDFLLEGSGAQTEANLGRYEGALYGLTGSGRVRGGLTDLHAALDIVSPAKLNVRARLNCLSPQLPLELDLLADRLQYPLLSAETGAPGTSLTAAAGAEGPEAADASTETDVTADTDITAEADGGRTADPAADTADSVNPETAAAAPADQPESETVVLERTELHARGNLAYGIATDFTGRVSGYGAQDVDIILRAFVSTERAVISRLELSGSYAGAEVSANLRGSADYAARTGFKGHLAARLGDGTAFSEMLRGPQEVSLAAEVEYPEDGNLRFRADRLDGRLFLNGTAAVLSGRDLGGDLRHGYTVGALDLDYLHNHVHAAGQLSGSSDLELNALVGSLADFLPEAAGSLSVRAVLHGDYMTPEVDVSGSSRFLKVRDFLAANIGVHVQADLKAMKGSLMTYADMLMPAAGMKPLRQCGLEFTGDIGSHRLNLNCSGANSGFIEISGGYDEQKGIWDGVLGNLFVTSEIGLSATLEREVKVTVDIGKMVVSAGEIDLRSNELGSLKIGAFSYHDGSMQTALSLSGLDLANLARFLPEGSKASGQVDLTAQLGLNRGVPDVSARMALGKGHLRLPQFSLFFEKAEFDSQFKNDTAQAKVDLTLSRRFGHLVLQAAVVDPAGARRLSGHVRLDDLNLAMFSSLGGGFNELTGKAVIDGDLGGSVSQPLFSGKITVTGTAEPHFGIGRIESFAFNLDARGTTGTLKGDIGLNEGRLKLDGSLNWSQGAMGDISVSADALPIFLLGYGICYADIHTRAVLSDSLSITGTVSVPKATIVVKDIKSGGIGLSSDEVIIERGTQELIKEAKEAAAPLNSKIDLTVKLGDDIRVSAMGLTAGLAGEIKIHKALNDKNVSGHGSVGLEDGTAFVYGRHFIVNKAKTLFSGNLADPVLDVEVVADPADLEEDIVAGVRVTGKASDMQIKLFSRPAKSENEVLSYLLYGHGLEKSSGNDAANSSAQLLMSLGLGTTTGLINSMTSAFGLSGVQVGTSGTGDETRVGVSAYLRKDIRVSYGYGVFNSVNEFTLRYEFIRRLYAQFVSSIDQAVDLIYSFDFD